MKIITFALSDTKTDDTKINKDLEQNIRKPKYTKPEIIQKIEQYNDPYFADKISDLIEDFERLNTYDNKIKDILAEAQAEDDPPATHVKVKCQTPLQRFLERTAGLMWWLSMCSLIFLGVVVSETGHAVSAQLQRWAVVAYGFSHLIFLAEYITILALARREDNISKKRKIKSLLYVLIPPLRLGKRHLISRKLIWLPHWNWCRADDALFDNLRLKFSLPMIIVALLIIPLLYIEMKMKSSVVAHFQNIDLVLDLCQAFIWVVFAAEFIIMISVSDERDRQDYAKKNWIDILIIGLPVLMLMVKQSEMLANAPALRLLRLNQITRVYRLKGVFTKVRHALMFADSIQRLMFPNPEKQLIHLQKKLRSNDRQRLELERQMNLAIRRFQEYRAKKAKKQKARMLRKDSDD